MSYKSASTNLSDPGIVYNVPISRIVTIFCAGSSPSPYPPPDVPLGLTPKGPREDLLVVGEVGVAGAAREHLPTAQMLQERAAHS